MTGLEFLIDRLDFVRLRLWSPVPACRLTNFRLSFCRLFVLFLLLSWILFGLRITLEKSTKVKKSLPESGRVHSVSLRSFIKFRSVCQANWAVEFDPATL